MSSIATSTVTTTLLLAIASYSVYRSSVVVVDQSDRMVVVDRLIVKSLFVRMILERYVVIMTG